MRQAVLEARKGTQVPWRVHSDPLGREFDPKRTMRKSHPMDGLFRLVVEYITL
jgi:hypothetical protein